MSRGLIRIILLAATFVGSVALNTPLEAVGASGPPTSVAAQRGGLRLELRLSHSTYPIDALVRARISMRNTTPHTVWIDGGGPQAPGKSLPQVEVLDSAGQSLPLSLTTWFPYPGPGPTPVALAPGQTVGGAVDLVVRGSRVRLSVTLLPNGRVSIRSGIPLSTQALHLHLLPSDAPTVQLNTDTQEPSATISRPVYAHGLPQAVWYDDCGGTNFDQNIYWSSVSTHLVPGCSPLHAWHVLVGWRGHSVAAIEVPSR